MCLEVLSGPTSFVSLADKTKKDAKFSVVAFTLSRDGQVELTSVSDFRLVGRQQIYEIQLDDGKVVTASASSMILMRSGRRKSPPEIVAEDSLMPLYFEEDVYGYSTYRVPGRCPKKKVSRLVAEWKLGGKLPKGTDVKHIDGNRKNYQPDNLEILVGKRSPKKCKNKVAQAYQAAQALLKECAAVSPHMKKIVYPRRRNNHRVVSVRSGRLEDVFTATVQPGSWVSVSGIFVELPAC